MAQQMNYQTSGRNISAPPRAKNGDFVVDADGVEYLALPCFLERGDLVAGVDKNNPNASLSDRELIALNRKIETAREQADMAKAAQLEAEQKAREAEAKTKEAEELALANARNLAAMEKKLEEEKLESERKLAELQAQYEAALKKNAGVETEQTEVKADTPTKPKRTPKRKVKEQVEEQVKEDFPDVDM